MYWAFVYWVCLNYDYNMECAWRAGFKMRGCGRMIYRVLKLGYKWYLQVRFRLTRDKEVKKNFLLQ